MTDQAKCAHMQVKYDRCLNGTGYSDKWICVECGMEFYSKLQISEPFGTRDKFAIAALQGCLSTGDAADEFWINKPESIVSTAAHAYEWADAMMKARNS